MKRLKIGLSIVSAAVLMQGCLALGSDEPEQGYTECGDFLAGPTEEVMCPPGRYCDNPTFSECVDGCLSNDNCADDQRCVKADGTQVGSCQAEIKRPASNPRNTVDQPEGFTECGEDSRATTCQPGQYCENATFGMCDEGCLSDLNCGEEQLCEKQEGRDVGSCQRAE